MFSGPGGREGRALVHVALHALGVLHQNHVEVLGEVLQGVPLLHQAPRCRDSFHAGELRRGVAERRLLLRAVGDELAAEHGDVGIELGRGLVARAGRVEGVGRRVEPHEPLARRHGVQEAFLAFGGHGRVVAPLVGLGQVAGGVEGEGVVLAQVAVEQAAVLGADDLESRPGPHLRQDLFGEGFAAVLAHDRSVLEALAPREVQHLALLHFRRERIEGEPRRPQGGTGAKQELATFHDMTSPGCSLVAVGQFNSDIPQSPCPQAPGTGGLFGPFPVGWRPSR